MDKAIKHHYKFVDEFLNMTKEEQKSFIDKNRNLSEGNSLKGIEPLQLTCTFEEFAKKWGGSISFEEAQERISRKMKGLNGEI